MAIVVIITLNMICDGYCGDHYFKYDIRWLLWWSFLQIWFAIAIVVIMTLNMISDGYCGDHYFKYDIR